MSSRFFNREVDGVILLDKPRGLSSNAALQEVRKLLRAAKAGHTGSLDPMATGLLPLCFGQATKLSAYLLDADKRYLASLRLGEKTSTGDAEGDITARSDATTVTLEQIQAVLPRFVGAIQQVPPMYSALKYQGQPLYRLARAGMEVTREARTVHIHALQWCRYEAGVLDLDIRCSKGTYIRTLAEDIAAALGQFAHLVALRRLAVAPFENQPMASLDSLRAAAQSPGALEGWLLPPGAALARWPSIRVDDVRAFQLARGQVVRVPGTPRGVRLAVCNQSDQLLGVAEADEQGQIHPKRWLGA